MGSLPYNITNFESRFVDTRVYLKKFKVYSGTPISMIGFSNTIFNKERVNDQETNTD